MIAWPLTNSARRHLAIIISDNVANYLAFHGKDSDWLLEQTARRGFPHPLDRDSVDLLLSGQPADSETLARAAHALSLPMNCRLTMDPKRFLRALQEDRLRKLARTLRVDRQLADPREVSNPCKP